MKVKTIQTIVSRSLTFPTAPERGRVSFPTPPSVYSLLVSVTETGRRGKKMKQHFLTGTHNSCQRDSAAKTKFSIVSNGKGRKKPHLLFGT